MRPTTTNSSVLTLLFSLVLVCLWVGTAHAQDASAVPDAAVSAMAPSVWLSCPSSFNPDVARRGSSIGPCEPRSANGAPITQVTAGDRIKVGWVSGNQGGGYVRLALVPETEAGDATNFDRNVLKTTCFGYDQREGRSAFGTCVHPCNGRPGCQWQADPADDERFDTTITVPYNLADGRYVLQMVALPGNAPDPIYSCSLLSITGGNTDLTCPAPDTIPEAPNCLKAAGPVLDTITTNVGAKAGAYCYASDGPSEIDAAIEDRPVNAECDPRVSCDLSVNDNICRQELFGISDRSQPSQTCDPEQTTQPTFTQIEATSTPPACITNGVISDEASFCTDYQYNCDTVCTGEGLNPVDVNRCTPNSDFPFGVDLSCQCGGQDLTNSILNALIPGACVPTQSVAPDVVSASTTTEEDQSDAITSTTTTTRTTTTTTTKRTKTKCRTKTRKTRTRTRKTRTRTRKTRTSRTSRTTRATPTPTCAPVIEDGTECNFQKDRPRCSGRKWVECLAKASRTSPTGFTAAWKSRSCSKGTACIDIRGGGFACDYVEKSPCLQIEQGRLLSKRDNVFVMPRALEPEPAREDENYYLDLLDD